MRKRVLADEHFERTVQQYAIVAEIDAATMERGDWSVTQFASSELCELAQHGLWEYNAGRAG